MTWFGWVLIGLFALNTLLKISDIGKPMKPLTHGVAVVVTVLNALVIVGILLIGTGRLA